MLKEAAEAYFKSFHQNFPGVNERNLEKSQDRESSLGPLEYKAGVTTL
jgi:hypothetical protein